MGISSILSTAISREKELVNRNLFYNSSKQLYTKVTLQRKEITASNL